MLGDLHAAAPPNESTQDAPSSMADTETYRIPGTETPSYFNQGALMGFLIGMLSYVPFGGLIGGAVGGAIEHARQAREQRDGRVVSPPTMMNRTMFIGAIFGAAAAFPCGIFCGIALGGPAAILFGTGSVAFGLAAVGGLLFGSAAAIVVGAWSGGKQGRERMAIDYEAAKQSGAKTIPAPAPGPETSQSREYEASTQATPGRASPTASAGGWVAQTRPHATQNTAAQHGHRSGEPEFIEAELQRRLSLGMPSVRPPR